VAEMSLLQQVTSLIEAARSTIKDGKLLAEDGTVEKRASICMGCEKLREKNGKYSCVTCGCSFKKKIAAHGASCPLKKW
jgi:hypothetical protein